MGIGVILSLSNRSDLLVINNKVDRERGTFKLNVDIRGGVD